MKEQIENRLKELKSEFQSGQKVLADLEAQQANLKNTLLRISGAIQVLEELLVQPNGSEQGNTHSSESYSVVSQPDKISDQ